MKGEIILKCILQGQLQTAAQTGTYTKEEINTNLENKANIDFSNVIENDNTLNNINAANRQLSNLDTPQAALSALGAGVRPNLLDNAYFVGGGTGWGVFPVNQIGFTSAGTYNVSTFDRWKIYAYTSGSVSLTKNGVKLNGQLDFGITLEHSRIPEIQNLAVTISALTSDGVLITATGILKNNGQTENFGIPFENGITANLIFIRRWNVDYLDLFFFQLTAPTDVTVVAAKLEIGDKQTLAYKDADDTWKLLPQPDSDYGTQLAKCQARLLILQNQTIPVTVFSKSVSSVIPTPVTMDEGAIPTVTFSGSAFLYVPSGSVGVDPSAYFGISVQPNGVMFAGTAEVSSNVPGVLVVDKIIISREL